ncbi:MAG: VOC family protein [Janthinobacterium lividum]
MTRPRLLQTVLDTEDPRGLAEFYRVLLGLAYRPGDERPEPGEPDPRGEDWLVLVDDTGGRALAFQQVETLPPPTWPEGTRPQMLHLDTTVPTATDLREQHVRALGLGARLLDDRFDDPDEPLYVYADPAGHPFCIFVAS